jgi:hypothetical protein
MQKKYFLDAKNGWKKNIPSAANAAMPVLIFRKST